MEIRWQLDSARRASRGGTHTVTVILLLFVGCTASLLFAQSPTTVDQLARIRRLFANEQWEQLVHEVAMLPRRGPDVDFYYGSALAHLERWDQARSVFLAGLHSRPRDERFPVELGGVAFKQKRYAEAARWLRQALRLAPNDAYANDLLATTYFLEGNTEAALQCWNRVAKPHLEQVRIEPDLKVKPALFDEAFAFAPASTLRLPDFLTTQTRVEGLGIFASPTWRLNALDDGGFDVEFSGQERDGWGDGKWTALLSTLRGAIYQTAYPEYLNWRGRAINFSSLVRWDAQKRRLLTSLSGPLVHNPKYRFDVGLDLRNENWYLRQSAQGPAPILGALNLRRGAIHSTIAFLNSARWNWLAGAELSYRDYRNLYLGPLLPAQVLLRGVQLKQTTQLNFGLIDLPERRFETKASLTSDLATIWSTPVQSFEKIQGRVSGHWYPQTTGDDYAVQGQIRSGKTFGSVPFDELFMLGMERDNDLWMRAHVGTRDGVKGSAPLGRDYFLSNWEVDKRIIRSGFFTVKLSPFLDIGNITDPLPGLGSERWMWDTGIQAKFRVLGLGVTMIYGKDLHSGHNAFYATAQ